MVHLDATKLRQAVLNLISNAAKFTHNGEITLRMRRTASADGDWIEIAVIDTGVGISLEQQKALFSKFTQANARIASKYGGTGLGLSLSQNLCRVDGRRDHGREPAGRGLLLHHPPAGRRRGSGRRADGTARTRRRAGRAWRKARSQARKEGYAGLSENPSSHSKGSKRRILIVDDDRSFLELAERLLLKEGFSAISTNLPEVGAPARPHGAARRDPARHPDARLRRLGGARGAEAAIRSPPPSRS